MRVLAAALLLLLALASPAGAQAPPPDERAAARAFADAAGRFADASAGPVEAFTSFALRPLRAVTACARIARRERRGALFIAFRTRSREFARDVGPALLAFRTELAAVPTGDPALAGGRAAWRRAGRQLEAVAPPGDLCAELRAWRRAGYPHSVSRAAFAELKALDAASGLGDTRRREKAVERMVELGVAREAAELFADPERGPVIER